MSERDKRFYTRNYTQHTAKHSTEQHGVSLFILLLSFFAIKKILSYFFIQQQLLCLDRKMRSFILLEHILRISFRASLPIYSRCHEKKLSLSMRCLCVAKRKRQNSEDSIRMDFFRDFYGFSARNLVELPKLLKIKSNKFAVRTTRINQISLSCEDIESM